MRKSIRSASGGFTVVELLMAIVVMGTAAFGILAFERGIVRSNQTSNDITAGTYIADWWFERARTEATLWRTGAADLSSVARTPMLFPIAGLLGTANNSTGWINVPPAGASPRYNRHIEEWTTASPATVDVGEFCSQYRLTVLVANELLRVEVRVFWYKTGVPRPADWAVCPSSAMLAGGDPNLQTVHTVQVASTLWRNS